MLSSPAAAVALAQVPGCSYTAEAPLPLPPAPELPRGARVTPTLIGLRNLFRNWGLDSARRDTPQWNPLGQLIPASTRIVVKPNWVMHRHPRHSLDCLITHVSLIDAVLSYAALAQPRSVVLGDAPVQGCDFEALRHACGLDELADRWTRNGLPVCIADFRRTRGGSTLGSRKTEEARPLDRFVLFDLGQQSLLEPLSGSASRFRVTMYDPDKLERAHSAGAHRYLIAREIMEAGVVINLPKLKCHCKAGITGALKNCVGMNGHKEFLPHHRKGSPAEKGDCYSTSSFPKRCAENLLDGYNRHEGSLPGMAARPVRSVVRALRMLAREPNIEGAWHGNDTLWRTCLDLQRILRYGTAEGRMAETPQRTVISITDAVIAGENEGPLNPDPAPLGLLTGSLDAAAADWVHALLMGFDPNSIPLVANAFRYGSFGAGPESILVAAPEGLISPLSAADRYGRAFIAPAGWRGHCERPTAGLVRVS